MLGASEGVGPKPGKIRGSDFLPSVGLTDATEPTQQQQVPPCSDTGVQITVDYLRGGFYDSPENILELVHSLTEGGYSESKDFGHMLYKQHHVFIGGLKVYTDPQADNMPPVMVDCPGTACTFLGLERLRVLFCNAVLSRADVAFDGAPITPSEAAKLVESGNVRCRSQKRNFIKSISGHDGDTLYIGSRTSERFMRCYDKHGFTRFELEFKGAYARDFLPVLLSDNQSFINTSVGLLRDFIDFVDTTDTSNISRAKLLPFWEKFTQGLQKIKLRVSGSTAPTVEKVVNYIEKQVAATLYTYHRLGYSVGSLLQLGKQRLKSHHRSLLAFGGASVSTV